MYHDKLDDDFLADLLPAQIPKQDDKSSTSKEKADLELINGKERTLKGGRGIERK